MGLKIRVLDIQKEPSAGAAKLGLKLREVLGGLEEPREL